MKFFIVGLLGLFFAISMSRANEEHPKDEKDHQEKSHDEGEHEKQELPGGVTFFEDETGEFSLKENVIQNFGIEVRSPERKNGFFELPEKAIVRSLKKTAVFVSSAGKFRAVPVKVVSSSSGKVLVSTSEQITQVVVSGNNFLQTILLSLEEGPSEGHGH